MSSVITLTVTIKFHRVQSISSIKLNELVASACLARDDDDDDEDDDDDRDGGIRPDRPT